MNDNEIMKKFEENFMNKEREPVQPYRATRNLNTEIDNPSINVNNNLNVNIVSEGNIDNTMTTNKIDVPDQPNLVTPNPLFEKQDEEKPTLVTGLVINQPTGQTPIVNPEVKVGAMGRSPEPTTVQNEQFNYASTYMSTMNMTGNKKRKTTIVVSQEIKMAFLLGLVILVFILVIPTISDFIRELKLSLQ